MTALPVDPAALSLERFAARLADQRFPEVRSSGTRAAVAAVLRFDRPEPEVLLIERALREGDRWSGHVSFPGGREEQGDANLVSTSVRETREEVGLDLTRAGCLLGPLEPLRAMSRGKLLPMTISPFVFHLTREEPLRLGDEAAACFWLPLAQAASGALDGWTEYRLGPIAWDLPCWRYDGHLVWGLTYKMIRGLLDTVAGGRDSQPQHRAAR